MAVLHKDVTSIHSTDLSSSQIWSVLNSLLFEALAPVVANSDVGMEIGLSCLSMSANAKRRISGLEQTEFMQVCFNVLLQAAVIPTEDNRIAVLTQLLDKGLERNIPYEYAQRSLVHPPLSYPHDLPKLHRHIYLYVSMYDQFRQDVVNRYSALTAFSARRNFYAKNQFGLSADEEEHYHVFVLSLMRAIDKFVPWRGTLASYILAWFENAKGASQFMVYSDEVFGLTRAIRKQVHEGGTDIRNRVIPLSDRENSIPDETDLVDIGVLLNVANMPNATLLFLAKGLPFYPKGTYTA